jgi:tetratricopeptide (TPR) repeat protein
LERFDGFRVDKPAGLRPSTPGGHAVISLALIGALALAIASAWYPDLRPFSVAVALAAVAVFLVRYVRFVRTLGAVERALARGDLASARAIAAPLLDRFPGQPLVEKAAADVLYATGDPLSAASLYERAAKRLPRDRDIVVGLVASYAALNKAGDARRAATMLPDDYDVRLALAWAELVALAGDRAKGGRLADELMSDLRVEHGAERTAMANVLVAIAAAQRQDATLARSALEVAECQNLVLEGPDRAFIGYLGGVALRELGLLGDARATFTQAMAAAPDTIGEALARRERSHIPESSGSSNSSAD